MRGLKKKLLLFVLMLTFLFLWYSINGMAKKIYTQTVSLRYNQNIQEIEDAPKQGISIVDLKELPTDDATIPKIMLWNEALNQIVKTEQGISANFTMLKMYGKNLLSMNMTDGAPLSSNDKSGCSIDEQAAYALFGTVDVVGKTIIMEEEPYVVRGIFQFNQPIILLNAESDDEDSKFSSAEFLFENSKNGRDDANMFLSKYSLPIPEYMIDGSLIAIFLKLIVALPAILLVLIVILQMLIRVFRVKNQLPLLLVVAIATLSIAASLVFVLDIPLEIPHRFIPSRWSDFSFWSNQIEVIGGHAKEILSRTHSMVESEAIEQLATLFAGCTVMMFTAILLLKRAQIKTSKQLMIWVFLGGIADFLFCVIIKNGVFNRRIFFALPCYFAIDYLIYKWDKFLKPIPQEKEATDEKANFYAKSFFPNE